MAGHSKWANIKRKKELVDAKKGLAFSKIVREITVAAREGGGDINANSTLRSVVDKAKAANLQKDKIDRAIAKGAGTLPGVTIVEASYEGYGPGGVAIMVSCLTDNKNRTVAEVRTAFSKNHGSLADAGSVSYIFHNKQPSFFVPLTDEDNDNFADLIDALDDLDDVVEVYHNAEIESDESE
jgi:YebC/PmpR family DNA-binding regulatory protein